MRWRARWLLQIVIGSLPRFLNDERRLADERMRLGELIDRNHENSTHGHAQVSSHHADSYAAYTSRHTPSVILAPVHFAAPYRRLGIN